jgi:predicted outer membrane repeat protein
VIKVSGNKASRVFSTATNLTVAISGLTIADGHGPTEQGGGIYDHGAMLTIANCVVRDNEVMSNTTYLDGGGIYSDGTLIVTGSTFEGNSAGGGGAGIAASGTLTVSDSTFTGNHAYNLGGGIYSSGTAIITGSTFDGNSGLLGGGIENAKGTMTITDSTISNNSTFADGGGIDNYNGTVSLTGSTISKNSAYSAGGIMNFEFGSVTIIDSSINGNSATRTDGGGIVNDGTMTVIDSTISGNSASDDYGGAIYLHRFSTVPTVTIVGSIVSGNTAVSGGAIYNDYGGAVTIMDSTLSANSASNGSGGGIVNYPSGVLTVLDSTLSGNSANGSFSGGGGIFNLGTATVNRSTLKDNAVKGASTTGGAIFSSGIVTVTDSTLSGNSANSAGVGIENLTTLTVISSTVSGNSASNGGGILQSDIFGGATSIRNTIVAGNSGSPSPDISGLLASQGHNLFGNGTGGTGFDPTDLVGAADDPIDPKLGPLQDNGGPTQTRALLVGSPAIAAGDISDAPPTDQRGAPRIVNGTIDMGAYEVQAAPIPSCAVVHALLWPPDGQLVNVGLSLGLNDDADPSVKLSLQVYANDNANASDASDIGPDTLQLRAERQDNGDGRVYLIVATATDASGQIGFDVCTVVVPHDQSGGSIAKVQAEAASAEAYYREYQTAPAGYALLGDGPSYTDGNGWSSITASRASGFWLARVASENPPTALSECPAGGVIPVIGATGNVLAGGMVMAIDRHFETSQDEPVRFSFLQAASVSAMGADCWIPDFWLSDPLLS